jgi:Xaa-Pro aminopeptidase
VGESLLIYGDSVGSATLRHEIRIPIMDPFLFGLIDETPHVMVSTIERERVVAAVPNAVLHDLNDLGIKELRESGLSHDEVWLELTSRAAAAMGVRSARVDPNFPLLVADRLREDGIELIPDAELFQQRRPAGSWRASAGRRSRPRPECGPLHSSLPGPRSTVTASQSPATSCRRSRCEPRPATPAPRTGRRRRRT